MELSNVTSVEPALAFSVNLKVFSCFCWVFEIASGHIWTTNDNFSSGIGFISNGIISLKEKRKTKQINKCSH